MPDRLLTMKQAALMVGASVSTFCEKYDEWGLDPVTLPGKAYNKRWVESEIQNFIAERLREREASRKREKEILKLVSTRRRA